MTTVGAETVPRHAAGTEWSRLGDDFVVLEPSGKVLRGFNATGARVWELVDGVRSCRAIAAQVATEFGEAPEQVLQSLLAFLQTLAERGLIDSVAAGAGAEGERK